jgi:hypothetical protein
MDYRAAYPHLNPTLPKTVTHNDEKQINKLSDGYFYCTLDIALKGEINTDLWLCRATGRVFRETHLDKKAKVYTLV